MRTLNRANLARIEQFLNELANLGKRSPKPKIVTPLYVDKAITELTADSNGKQILSDLDELERQRVQCQKPRVRKDETKSSNIVIPETLLRSKKLEKIDRADRMEIQYSQHSALAFLCSAALQKFAALTHILNEPDFVCLPNAISFVRQTQILTSTKIKLRDPEFTPKTIFDCFGGVGSTIWSIRQTWPDLKFDSLIHYEPRKALIEIARQIERYHRPDGKVWLSAGESESNELDLVHYKQFYPSSINSCDLVVSGFGLPPERLDLKKLICRLIKTVRPGGYMIFLESSAGFRIIDTIRELVRKEASKSDSVKVHIFAPCGQDQSCPLNQQGSCYFTKSHPKPFIDNVRFTPNETQSFDYSYLVFKFEQRSNLGLPRVLKEKRSGRAQCFVCCAVSENESEVCHINPRPEFRQSFSIVRSLKSDECLPVQIGKVLIDKN